MTMPRVSHVVGVLPRTQRIQLSPRPQSMQQVRDPVESVMKSAWLRYEGDG